MTERLQIVDIPEQRRIAFVRRDVVDISRLGDPALALAFLTERMRGDVPSAQFPVSVLK